jgi:hypothetical protein
MVTMMDVPRPTSHVIDRDRESISSRRLHRAYGTLGVHDPDPDRSRPQSEEYPVMEVTVSVDIRDREVGDRVWLPPWRDGPVFTIGWSRDPDRIL